MIHVSHDGAQQIVGAAGHEKSAHDLGQLRNFVFEYRERRTLLHFECDGDEYDDRTRKALFVKRREIAFDISRFFQQSYAP